MADRGFHLALFATLLALLVLLLGAWTRLTHAGLGCPDWPGCYGFATVPSGALQQALAQSRFPQAVLEADKGWYEMIHRYGAALLGLSIGLLMLQAWARGQGLRLPLLLLGLVIAQALLGMWTVTLRLWPPVVTLHLLGAVAILGLLLVLTLRLSGVGAPVIRSSVLLRGLALLALMLAVLQIGLGGWSALIMPPTSAPTCRPVRANGGRQTTLPQALTSACQWGRTIWAVCWTVRLVLRFISLIDWARCCLAW